MFENNLNTFFKKYNLTDSQSELVNLLDNFLSKSNKESQVFLLKGYAGTGKTFITKGLTEYFNKNRRNYTLAAPTGKAAKVISKKTQTQAYTLHKTIYSNTDLKEYKRSESDRTFKFYFDLAVNQDSTDSVYIIDEASMISNVYSEMEFIRFGSGYLLQDLIQFINLDNNDHNKKIIFIGDNAQLPPVNMKFSPALNKDYLLENFGLKIDEYELTDVVRQKEYSGILKNSIKLRKSLEVNTFNKLNIDHSFDDVNPIKHGDLIKKYLQVTNHKIDDESIVIAYTNNSVKEYNDRIRTEFFDDISKVNLNEKIMIVRNNSNYDIFLSNGDFGIVKSNQSTSEKKVILLKKKNDSTGVVETTPVELSFIDLSILFEDIDGTPHLIQCKVIENLLFSSMPALSSEENRALYLDFAFRHPGLKSNTKEFKEALKNDPYFNALQIKFGYAITCHKAQGSEWKNIFLNCESHQSYLSESYFRWLYTAITRSSDILYVLNEPQIGLFSKVKVITNGLVADNKMAIASPTTEINEQNSNPFGIEDKNLLGIFSSISNTVRLSDIAITMVEHNQYQEIYSFKAGDDETRIIIWYNKDTIVTKIVPIEDNILSKLISTLLQPIVSRTLVVEKNDHFDFSEDFLMEYYSELKQKLEITEIIISNIEHLSFMERYTFSRNKEIALIDFYYNGKKQFSNAQINKKSNSTDLAQDILRFML